MLAICRALYGLQAARDNVKAAFIPLMGYVRQFRYLSCLALPPHSLGEAIEMRGVIPWQG